ncbi:amidohydrolase family protein [Cnuibacter sp. UC19_7]|uniref:amidohydrolase family protein n=1 Tax=Cnuibacter sp. UC19_7 TaxID=3350166 RepID=UPI00366DFC1B
MTRVDAHAHVFRPAAVSPRGSDELAPHDRDAPVEGFTAELERHGVDRAVLVPLDEHDDYVRECLASDPVRFAAVAVSSDAERGRARGRHAESVSDALDRRRAGFRFGGLRTTWLGEPGQDIRDSPALPMLRWCADQGVVLWAYLPPDQFPLVDAVARELPDLAIALNHFGFSPADMRVDAHGRPWFASRLPDERVDAVCALAAHPRMHVLVSGHYAVSQEDAPYSDLRGPTTRYLEAYGADRVMWGSDMPWPAAAPGYGALLDAIGSALDEAGSSAAERELVLGGTASRLFALAPA